MLKYSRFMSLSRQFARLRPIPQAFSSSFSIVVGRREFQPSPRLKNVKSLMDTAFRMRYALRIQDWVCLHELFEEFDRLSENEKRLHGRISLGFIRTLVMMLDNKLLSTALEEFADEIPNTTNNKKRSMSIRNAEALCSIKQKLVKYKAQYNNLITSSREAPQELMEFLHYQDDEEILTEFKPFPYYGSPQSQVGAWVKGQDEIAWELVETEFYDVPVLQGEQKMEHIKQMVILVKSAVTPSQKLRFILHVINAQIDTNPTLFTPMSSNLWKDCVFNMFVALDILAHHPNICVTPNFFDGGPWKYETKKTTGYKGKIRLEGDLLHVLMRIYFEFDMGLKFISPDTQCYWDRVKDEAHLFLLFNNFMDYFTWKKDFSTSAHVAFLLLELVYHKSQADYDLLRKRVNRVDFEESGETETSHKNKDVQAPTSSPPVASTPNTVPVPRRPNFPKDCREFVENLVSVIYDHGPGNIRLHALICDLYHYALIGDFSNAKYLLSTTHLDSIVQDEARSTKLHYNRATAQLGVCAFRAGAIQSAYSSLSDLYHTGRIEDMLAQDASQTQPRVKDLEHTMFEPLGKIPYHMHIDLELLKAVHLICAMLLNNLKTAVKTHDNRGNFSSKSETGDSESVLHQVKAADEALKEGNFVKSFDIVESLDCLRPLWREDGVLEMLYTMIKEQALKNYLVTCSKYPSVRLEKLARWFELPEADTKRIVDGMMEELHASWDESTRRIVFCNVSRNN